MGWEGIDNEASFVLPTRRNQNPSLLSSFISLFVRKKRLQFGRCEEELGGIKEEGIPPDGEICIMEIRLRRLVILRTAAFWCSGFPSRRRWKFLEMFASS